MGDRKAQESKSDKIKAKALRNLKVDPVLKIENFS